MVIHEHYESKIPKMFGDGCTAITFGHHIFYKQAEDNITAKLRVHESKHVEQYDRDGFFGFLFKYAKEYILGRKNGCNHLCSYFKISYEIEAYEAEYKYNSLHENE